MKKATNLASRLTKSILIQESVETPDGMGGFKQSWRDYIETWAEIKTINDVRFLNSEYFDNMKLNNKNYYQITTRFHPSVNEKMRVVFSDKCVNIIKTINVNEDSLVLLILAEEVK